MHCAADVSPLEESELPALLRQHRDTKQRLPERPDPRVRPERAGREGEALGSFFLLFFHFLLVAPLPHGRPSRARPAPSSSSPAPPPLPRQLPSLSRPQPLHRSGPRCRRRPATWPTVTATSCCPATSAGGAGRVPRGGRFCVRGPQCVPWTSHCKPRGAVHCGGGPSPAPR